ncbi:MULTISPECIES: GNAT family N-acetyltransferase [Achromobacter]|uniref:GNAT family N-acetyltransferase n=1 Tax=Achromobacter spanius TaxID=217203 RepID=A0ABY8GYQ8_9BURK|nr:MULTISPECIES: GNAT family N-acetyltransferase [Achromobacter]WAI80830.1 GNAT family N-acetyltransferase [Achromobacter spanius]WEX96343.1 GNAT family N-acetyltransferase [Achromobacter sp. SS2-2022]WFP09936.1 GNAT family N-acetyltransferase [Achromobacter spanius]
MNIAIRPAAPSDAAQIYAFITELAVYERAAHEVIASADDVARTLFAPGAPAKALMCLADGKPIGYAVYFYSYSTWLGKNGIYLEDLYITPEHRGIGAGRDLLRHLAQEAVANDCGRLEWSVLDWNQPAIDFYVSIGARPLDEWVRYRLTDDALKQFAEGRRQPA